MAEIASAYLSILPSFKGGGSAISKQVEGPIRSSGTSLGKTFGNCCFTYTCFANKYRIVSGAAA